jgi:hypothetical protein
MTQCNAEVIVFLLQTNLMLLNLKVVTFLSLNCYKNRGRVSMVLKTKVDEFILYDN